MPHIVHHAPKLLFALDSGLVFQPLVLIIAASKLVAVLDLGLLTDCCLSFFAAFLESFNALALQLSDRTIVKEVKGFACNNKLPPKPAEHSSARVIEQVDSDDGRQGSNEWHDIIFVIDLIILEVEMGQVGQLSQLLAIRDR